MLGSAPPVDGNGKVGDGKGGIVTGALVVDGPVGFPAFAGVGLGTCRLVDGAGAPGELDSLVPVRAVECPRPGEFVTVPG